MMHYLWDLKDQSLAKHVYQFFILISVSPVYSSGNEAWYGCMMDVIVNSPGLEFRIILDGFAKINCFVNGSCHRIYGLGKST